MTTDLLSRLDLMHPWLISRVSIVYSKWAGIRRVRNVLFELTVVAIFKIIGY